MSLPQPYSFLLLKLFAYRDRRLDRAKEFGQYHAFDLYRIIAMMTEPDMEEAEELRDRYAEDVIVREAREMVTQLFGGPDAPGVLAAREHARQTGDYLSPADAKAFADDLAGLLPPIRQP